MHIFKGDFSQLLRDPAHGRHVSSSAAAALKVQREQIVGQVGGQVSHHDGVCALHLLQSEPRPVQRSLGNFAAHLLKICNEMSNKHA